MILTSSAESPYYYPGYESLQPYGILAIAFVSTGTTACMSGGPTAPAAAQDVACLGSLASYPLFCMTEMQSA